MSLMRPYYILDADHHPVNVPDVLEWGRWIEEHKYGPRLVDNEGQDDCRVGSTHIGEAWISTTFLGIDHSFDDGEPVLFETMVFGGVFDQEQRRYCTWDEAAIGHAQMVDLVTYGTEERADSDGHVDQEGRVAGDSAPEPR